MTLVRLSRRNIMPLRLSQLGHSATSGSVRVMSVLAPIADSRCGAFMGTRLVLAGTSSGRLSDHWGMLVLRVKSLERCAHSNRDAPMKRDKHQL